MRISPEQGATMSKSEREELVTLLALLRKLAPLQMNGPLDCAVGALRSVGDHLTGDALSALVNEVRRELIRCESLVPTCGTLPRFVRVASNQLQGVYTDTNSVHFAMPGIYQVMERNVRGVRLVSQRGREFVAWNFDWLPHEQYLDRHPGADVEEGEPGIRE